MGVIKIKIQIEFEKWLASKNKDINLDTNK